MRSDGLAARLSVPSSSSDLRALSLSLTSADEFRKHGLLFWVRDECERLMHPLRCSSLSEYSVSLLTLS